jgi:lipopolysaccharide transport system ATP-binding protein
MAEALVGFEHVYKKFRRGERHDSLRDLVPSTVRGLLGRGRAKDVLAAQEFWALRDVSFGVREGEALGIVGPNGAGKSTTLKLLTRILRPTRGDCWVKGRVGALIEIAAGFHPDLTGRENVYLQGAIMGMRHAEIASRLDEILAFAGVESFVDTPVKRYSSGMNARLGFAIAAHLDPRVLIIDEVLSVGDMAFQQKCVARMLEFKRRGTAIVFVSHNLEAVGRLCDRAILLSSGEVAAHGPVPDVVSAYLGRQASGAPSVGSEIEMSDPQLVTDAGQPVNLVRAGTWLRLLARYRPTREMRGLIFGLRLNRSTDNLLVYEGQFTDAELGIRAAAGVPFWVEFRFQANLTSGQYHAVSYTLEGASERLLGRLSPAASFRVEEARSRGGVAGVGLTARVQVEEPARTAPS